MLLAKFRDAAVADLQKIMDSLYDEAVRDPDHLEEIDKRIVMMGNTIQSHKDQSQTVNDSIAQAIIDGMSRLGGTLPKELASSGSTTAADLMEQWLQGDTSVQKKQESLLSAHGYSSPVGLDRVANDQQVNFLNKLLDEKMKSIQTFGGTPDLSKISNSDLLMSGFNSRPAANSLLGGTGTAQLQFDYVRNTALPRAQEAFAVAQSNVNWNTDDSKADEFKMKMDQAGEAVVAMGKKLNELGIASNSALKDLADFGTQIQQTLEGSLADVFDSLINRTNNLRDVLSNFGKSISHEFSTMLSKSIVDSVMDQSKGGLGGLVGMAANAIGGWIKGGSNSYNMVEGPYGGTTIPGSPVPTTDASYGAEFAANGAVFSGGFMPVKAFSTGGIAGRPMIGIIGEGGRDEAIVPMHDNRIPLGFDAAGGAHAILPGGRKIPAAFFAGGGVATGGFGHSPAFDGGGSMPGSGSGGGHTEVHIFNVGSREEAIAQGYKGMKNQILNEVYASGAPGGKFRKILGKTL